MVKELYAATVEAVERLVASHSGVAEENAVPGFFRLWSDDQIQHLRVETPTEGAGEGTRDKALLLRRSAAGRGPEDTLEIFWKQGSRRSSHSRREPEPQPYRSL